jgi:hypothetical protein
MPDMTNNPNSVPSVPIEYIRKAAQKLLGNKLREEAVTEKPTEDTSIDKNAIKKAVDSLKKYKDGKAKLEKRIVEEERWWKLRHWDVIRNGNATDRPEPTSAWLFNSVCNKHADMMDNYPEPNVLPREQADEMDAKTLSAILPVVFERNNYELTYSNAAWYKLKHGVVAKGVFWNKELEDGMGDIDIRYIDILNVFWEPGIRDIQDSRNLFIVDLRDNDLIEREFPQLKGKLGGKHIEIEKYVYDDTVAVSEKSAIVDWYYKKRNSAGKVVLHYCKFVGDTVIYSSESEAEYAERGFYDHGKYPIVFDVLFPEEGTPVGFGYIAVMQSPQMFIDKLSQAIMENAVISAKPRFWSKKSVGINKDQFLDWSQPIVEVEGDIDEERLRPIDVQQVGGNILNVLQMKIDELKETSSNRDFSNGSTASGVTSGAAISALQESGNKTSRDMISASYRTYTQECYLAIELIRQFYDETRSFRIIGDTGKYEYIQYNNARIQGEALPPAYAGQELEPNYVQAFRKPVFDIVIKPQKRSPYSKMAQNELAKELYGMGFFNPELATQSLVALELMDFDGEEKVKEQVQQGQTLLNTVNQLMQELNLLKSMVGIPMQGGEGQPMPNAAPSGMGSAIVDSQKAGMTDYGARLAARAKPNMDSR